MPRVHVLARIDKSSGTPVSGATVTVRTVGTTDTLPQTLYAAATGGATVANPITTGINGMVNFWLDTPVSVDLHMVGPGLAERTDTVEPLVSPDRLMNLDASQTVAGDKTFTGAVVFNGALSLLSVEAQIANGSAANPSLRLQNSPTTGFYRAGAHQLGIAANGVARAILSDQQLQLYGGSSASIIADGGSAGAPVDAPSYVGSKRYGNIHSVIYSTNKVGSEARETFAVIGANVHQTGDAGYATGVYGRAEYPAGHVNLAGENSITGILGEAYAAVGVTGQSLRGGNFRVEHLHASADPNSNAVAVEINVRADGDRSHRIGVWSTAVGETSGGVTTPGTGDGVGTEVDAAFAAQTKKPATPWKYAFDVPQASHSDASDNTTGTLFGARLGVLHADTRNRQGGGLPASILGRGVDFEHCAFVTVDGQVPYAWISPGFSVGPDGQVTFQNAVAFSGSARRMYINAYAATITDRFFIQNDPGGAPNNQTMLNLMPSGSNTQSGMNFCTSSTPTVADRAILYALGTGAFLNTGSNVTSWSIGVNNGTIATINASGLVVTGYLHMSGSGRRIYGDFNNATLNDRTMFQAVSGTNTFIGVMPASGSIAGIDFFNSSTPASSGAASVYVSGSVMALATGSGVTSINHYINGTLRSTMTGTLIQFPRNDQAFHVMQIDASNGGARWGVFGSLGVQQYGPASTAAGTYGAPEALMLQRVYDAMRTYGLLGG